MRAVWNPLPEVDHHDITVPHHVLPALGKDDPGIPCAVETVVRDEILKRYHIGLDEAFLEIKGSHNRGYLDSMNVYESGIMDFINRYVKNEEVSK